MKIKYTAAGVFRKDWTATVATMLSYVNLSPCFISVTLTFPFFSLWCMLHVILFMFSYLLIILAGSHLLFPFKKQCRCHVSGESSLSTWDWASCPHYVHAWNMPALFSTALLSLTLPSWLEMPFRKCHYSQGPDLHLATS